MEPNFNKFGGKFELVGEKLGYKAGEEQQGGFILNFFVGVCPSRSGLPERLRGGRISGNSRVGGEVFSFLFTALEACATIIL